MKWEWAEYGGMRYAVARGAPTATSCAQRAPETPGDSVPQRAPETPGDRASQRAADSSGDRAPQRTPAAPPIVLFLHGAGERGSDGRAQVSYPFFSSPESVFSQLVAAGVTVVAPQAPERDSWSVVPRWGDQLQVAGAEMTPALAMALEIVEVEALRSMASALAARDGPSVGPRPDTADAPRPDTADAPRPDTADAPRPDTADAPRPASGPVALAGLSMGGYGVWELLARVPGRFAAAVPVCGGGDVASVAELAATPIWAFHGGRDPLIPAALSRQMTDALANARLTLYADVGHDAWSRAFVDPQLAPWLLAALGSRS